MGLVTVRLVRGHIDPWAHRCVVNVEQKRVCGSVTCEHNDTRFHIGFSMLGSMVRGHNDTWAQ